MNLYERILKYAFGKYYILSWFSSFLNNHCNPPSRKRRKFTVFLIFVVQLLSHVQLFVTPWTAAHRASLVPSPSPGDCSNSSPLIQRCYSVI